MEVEAPVFRALADPTRREILSELKDGELAAGEIVDRFTISGPSISRHLAILKAAGLVTERRKGNRIYYKAESGQLAATISDFVSRVCPAQLVLRRQRRRV
jgi:DNA-binding transcriptional ArsR family regulator